MSLNTLFNNGTHKIETAGVIAPALPQTKITRLAFLERFTDAEAIAIDLASQGATVEAATVRRFMSKVNAATFIDLARQDTIDGVNSLVGYGFLTAERANAILTGAVQAVEIPQ